jgi:hypothetical protein
MLVVATNLPSCLALQHAGNRRDGDDHRLLRRRQDRREVCRHREQFFGAPVLPRSTRLIFGFASNSVALLAYAGHTCQMPRAWALPGWPSCWRSENPRNGFRFSQKYRFRNTFNSQYQIATTAFTKKWRAFTRTEVSVLDDAQIMRVLIKHR